MDLMIDLKTLLIEVLLLGILGGCIQINEDRIFWKKMYDKLKIQSKKK